MRSFWRSDSSTRASAALRSASRSFSGHSSDTPDQVISDDNIGEKAVCFALGSPRLKLSGGRFLGGAGSVFIDISLANDIDEIGEAKEMSDSKVSMNSSGGGWTGSPPAAPAQQIPCPNPPGLFPTLAEDGLVSHLSSTRQGRTLAPGPTAFPWAFAEAPNPTFLPFEPGILEGSFPV